MLSFAVIKHHDQKQTEDERVYLHLQVKQFIMELKLRPPQRSAAYGSGQLTHIAQAQLSRDGSTHSGLDPHTSINNEENVPQTHSQSNLMEAISPARFTLAGVSS